MAWSDVERSLTSAGPFAVSIAPLEQQQQQHAVSIGGNGIRVSSMLSETHLILYVAWRKLWMERVSAEGSCMMTTMLSLIDLHRAVTSEASRLLIDELRLCSVVPDFRQTMEIARTLTRRGVLEFHKCGGELQVAMSEKTGQDMMDSINASILDRMENVQEQIFEAKRAEAEAEDDDGQGPAKKRQRRRRTDRPIRRARKKVFHIPPSVLELHLECERRDLVTESKRFKELMMTMKKKKKRPSGDGGSTPPHSPGREDST